MKAISIYYHFQSQKDTSLNFCSINFANIDDCKVKHILASLPISFDKAYHFRFRTLCEEVEPRMQAWIDISNPNAKAPLVNNTVYVKILELPKFGLSKIFTQAKMQTIKLTHEINRSQSQQQPQPLQQQKQVPTPKSNIQITSVQQPSPVRQQVQPIINTDIRKPEVQHYQHQQKALDNLLGEDYETSDQQKDEFEEYQVGSTATSPPKSQHHVQSMNNNFGSFPAAPSPAVQQQNQPSGFVQRSSELNLLGEDEMVQSGQEIVDREKIKQDNIKKVESHVANKVGELKKMWEDEDQYNIWRQDNKDQLEVMIMVIDIHLLPQKWAFKDGSRNQVRTMLSTLHEILWPESGWNQISVADLLSDAAVKRRYHDAIRVVHPDKNQIRDNRQRFIAERVFFELNQSFNQHRKTVGQHQQ